MPTCDLDNNNYLKGGTMKELQRVKEDIQAILIGSPDNDSPEKLSDEILSLKIDGTTKQCSKCKGRGTYYFRLPDDVGSPNRTKCSVCNRTGKVLVGGTTLKELLEKLDKTKGTLCIIKKLNEEDGDVIWQGGQE